MTVSSLPRALLGLRIVLLIFGLTYGGISHHYSGGRFDGIADILSNFFIDEGLRESAPG